MGFVNPASPGWGLGWVCFGTVCGVVPLVSAVCGVRGWASVSACFWDVCGFVGAPLAPRRFRFGRAVWACVLGLGPGCAQPFLAGLSGCVFCALVFSFVFLCGPCPSIPFLSGWAGGSLFFIFFCFGVPFPRGPLLLAWCCRFWVGGPPVPLWGSCLRCLLGGGLAACGGVGGRFGGCGLFSCLFPLPPPFFFGGGGLACSSLCLPWAGARTGLHSVLSSGLLSSVAFCVAAFRPHGSGGLCTRWARRPFLPGYVLALSAARLRQAAACGFRLGGWGCSCPFPSAVPAVIFWVVRHRCRQARCGPVCGLWCWCVACWRGALQGVQWPASVSPSG